MVPAAVCLFVFFFLKTKMWPNLAWQVQIKDVGSCLSKMFLAAPGELWDVDSRGSSPPKPLRLV